MSEGSVGLGVSRDVFFAAAREIECARRELELDDVDGVRIARDHLNAAVNGLKPAAADDHLPIAVRRASERCRTTLSSHLLAAEALATAGVSTTTIVRVVRRATDAAAVQVATAIEAL
jgi:hypothetical protein